MYFAVVFSLFWAMGGQGFYNKAECRAFLNDLPWYTTGKCIPLVVQDVLPEGEKVVPRKVKDHGERQTLGTGAQHCHEDGTCHQH